MATAGVTHAVVLDGQGYLLVGSDGEGGGRSGRNGGGNGKNGAMSGYVQETLPGATAPRAALYTA